MAEVNFEKKDNLLVIKLDGYIDSANAGEVESKINDIRAANPSDKIEIDCEKLKYISSAGLRIVLRIKKAVCDTSIINVSPEVYEIFDMTGKMVLTSTESKIGVRSLETGVYFVRVNGNTTKLVVK